MTEINERLLSEALVSLARRAGDKILEVYRSADFSVERKSDDSPVTAADLAVHELLDRKLPQLLDIPLISEEQKQLSFSERSQWDRYWLIDPLDGTKEFLAQNDEFCVNIALIENHKPRLGVVHAPVADETYVGSAELGAWKYRAGANPQRISARALKKSRPIVALISHRHGKEAVEELLEQIAKRWPKGVETQSMGSALKSCLIAEGKADIYARLGPTSEWDTGAPHAILNAAGGKLVTSDLEELEYNRTDSLLNPDFYALGDKNFDWNQLLKE